MINLSQIQKIIPGFIQIENPDGLQLPEYWMQIFRSEDTIRKKSIFIEKFVEVSGDKLSNSLSYLSKCDIEFILFNSNIGVGLLLVIDNNQDIQYRVLLTPIDIQSEIFSLINNVDLSNFYSFLGNGFVDPQTLSMGLYPIKYVKPLSQLIEESDLQDIDSSLNYIFFSNGASGYLCYDSKNYCGLIFWTDDSPDYPVEFWNVLDEWILIGLSEE